MGQMAGMGRWCQVRDGLGILGGIESCLICSFGVFIGERKGRKQDKKERENR